MADESLVVLQGADKLGQRDLAARLLCEGKRLPEVRAAVLQAASKKASGTTRFEKVSDEAFARVIANPPTL